MCELPNHWEDDVRQLKAAQAAQATPPPVAADREAVCVFAYRLADAEEGFSNGVPVLLQKPKCWCGQTAEYVTRVSDGGEPLSFRCVIHCGTLASLRNF